MGKEQANGCPQCPTRGLCIASELELSRLDDLPNWLAPGSVLNSGQTLYRAGDSADHQYQVRSGMFKTVVLNTPGDEFITGFHLPGDILGMVQDQGCHVESAVALDAGNACELNLGKLKANPASDISAALIRHMSEQARRALEHQVTLSQSSAQARFAAFCLNYSAKLKRQKRCARVLATPMSRTDLANYLGMTLESLSRVVSKLNAAGVIQATRSQIEITQPDTLKALGLHATL